MRALFLMISLTFPASATAQQAQGPETSEQTIVYDLTIDGQSVGQRDVTIRTVPADDLVPYESRIIQSYQKVEAQLAGKRVDHTSRISARVTDKSSSFVAAITEGGSPREVQGRQHSDGRWTVIEIGWGSKKTWEYRRTEVDMSSMEFLDPVRHHRLTDDDMGLVLVAESGQVLAGKVTDLGEGTVRVAGRDIAVNRVVWTPGPGKVEMAWSIDGLLVEYEVAFMGKTLVATAREFPEARSFGDLDIQATITQGAPVVEEEL